MKFNKALTSKESSTKKKKNKKIIDSGVDGVADLYHTGPVLHVVKIPKK